MSEFKSIAVPDLKVPAIPLPARTQALVARQPICDSMQHSFAYELLYRKHHESGLNVQASFKAAAAGNHHP